MLTDGCRQKLFFAEASGPLEFCEVTGASHDTLIPPDSIKCVYIYTPVTMLRVSESIQSETPS